KARPGTSRCGARTDRPGADPPHRGPYRARGREPARCARGARAGLRATTRSRVAREPRPRPRLQRRRARARRGAAGRAPDDDRRGVPARVAEMSPARACAYTVVRRVFEQGAYADRALAGEAAGLEPPDRALATQIAYGTVQRRGTLDHFAQRLLRRPLRQLEPAVLAAIWIGLFQLIYLDRVATHAAVDESVELAKRESPAGAGLVNAVLRRAAREGDALLDSLSDTSPEAAAVMHSVPHWLAELWWSELGAEQATALLRRINEPAE